jgi:hypothetical protein
MGLFNAIEARPAGCTSRRATRALYALVALSHLVVASVAHAQATPAPAAALEEPAIDSSPSLRSPQLAASDVTRASEGLLARGMCLDERRAWSARSNAAGADEISAAAEGTSPPEIVGADGFENIRKTGKAIPGCASNPWTLRRFDQALRLVPFTRAEHVSSLVVEVHSPRGPPIHG